MPNWKLEISYSGKDFYGFQRLKGRRTVQGEIERILSYLFNEEIKVFGAGRTDAGVHALRQVISFKSLREWEEEKLKSVLNKLLPADIVVKSVRKVDDGFHARFSAKRRWYMYFIYNHSDKNIFLNDFSWWLKEPLDRNLLMKSAVIIKGKHDFVNFAVKESEKNTLIEIYESFWYFKKDYLFYFICAPYFLRKMVRFLVGSMVEISLGKKSLEVFESYLIKEYKDRFSAPAPSNGLYLYKIDY